VCRANDRGGGHVDAIVVRADPAELRARRERALSAVRMTEDELCARVKSGSATPDERDAWQEVDTVAPGCHWNVHAERGARPQPRSPGHLQDRLGQLDHLGLGQAHTGCAHGVDHPRPIGLVDEQKRVATVFVVDAVARRLQPATLTL
jgi:hypothetical protein